MVQTMDSFLQEITDLRLSPIEMCEQQPSGERVVDGSYLLSATTDNRSIKVKRGDVASQIIFIHGSEDDEVSIEVESGATLSIVEVVNEGAKSRVNINQNRDSRLDATLLQLGDSELSYIVQLNGEGCESTVNLLQMTTNKECSTANIRIEHNSANCSSRSTSQAIAGGESTSTFKGMIYVATDAQSTEAHQNSRNIALTPNAKIVAEPQLEIYADDVKCSHGATIGEMNQEAILYLRQRGLDERQARKLQLEGFANQLAQGCPIEEVIEALTRVIGGNLEEL